MAAWADYAEFHPVLFTDIKRLLVEVQGDIDHLFGNLLGWSSTACDNEGYRVLGENCLTNSLELQVVGEERCVRQDEQWRGTGFRLIRIER